MDAFRNIHDTCSFNDHYLNLLLDNLSKRANKIIVLLGDFNIDLLNFDTSEQLITFLYDLNSNSLQLQILLPNKISKNTEILIDNIFCNLLNPLIKSTISGNISSIMSDHLPQFFTIPNFFSNSPPTKYNMFYDWENFNDQSFLEDFEKINWDQKLQLNQDNVNITFENYLNTANTLINFHTPFKNSTKNNEFQKKPWSTKGIQNLIEKKNRHFKKCIRYVDRDKNILYQEYKTYRNSLLKAK